MNKRDSNNFINLIVQKIELARNFHQRIALSITSKKILGHVVIKFYLRKRFKKLYLYTRVDKHRFASKSQVTAFYNDFKLLIPNIKFESTQGHYKGFITEINELNRQTIIDLLKLIAILARPKNFYVKDTQIYKSIYNYIESSQIPIHYQITQKNFNQLTCYKLIDYLMEIKPYDKRTIPLNDNDYFATDVINSTSI